MQVSAPKQTRLGRALRVGGGYLGGLVPFIGQANGTAAGAAFSKWLGSGAYSVESNSLVQKSVTQNVPVMHSGGESALIRHREYIGDVRTSGTANTFSIDGYALNPGVETTFPWLAGVAAQYQEYTFKGVIFEFVSTSADALNSTNTALGTVLMATQYRATADAFTNKFGMNNQHYSNDGKPSDNLCHPIECDPKENPYRIQYVRTGSVPTGEDPKTYDLGTFYIATTGFQGTSVNVGELWVSYEVELRKPAIPTTLGYSVNMSHYTANAYTDAIPLNGWSLEYDTIGLERNGNVITFPENLVPGLYMFTFAWTGDATAVIAPAFTMSGMDSSTIWNGSTASRVHAANGQTVSSYVIALTAYISGSSATLTVGAAGTLPANGSYGEIFVTQLNTAQQG